MPKFSIIIPIYGVELFIRDCLETIESQSFTDFEVIGIDDGTKDDSAKIFAEFATKDPRFKLLHQKNSGAGMARNHGLSVATGEYVCFMDPDDFYPDDNVLMDIWTEFENTHVNVCCGNLEIFQEPGSEPYSTESFFYTKHQWIPYKDSLRYYVFQTFTFSMKFLKEKAVEFPPYRVFEDPPFLVHALTASGGFQTLPRSVYTYRVQNKAMNCSPARVYDMARGAGDILFYTRDNPDYSPLHENVVNNYFGDFTQKNAVGNLFLGLIMDNDVSFTRFMRDLSLNENYGLLLPPLKRITGKKRTGQLPSDFTGFEWKFVLWRFRFLSKFRGFFQCIRENGLVYTLKHLFKK